MESCDETTMDLGCKPQKELVYNKLLPYAETLDLESEQLLSEVKTNLGRAIMSRDIRPGASFWAWQFVRYIQLYGRKFSKEDHLLFIKLVYEMVIIPDLELDVVQQLSHLLTQLLKKKELITREELELPWKPLADLYERVLYSPYEHMEMLLLPSNIESTLKALIRACRVYFSVDSTQEILENWRPLLCPFDVTMTKAVLYFELFLPTLLPPEHHEHGFKLWFQEMMDIWNACHNTPLWECNLVWLFARLANDCIGYIDWEPYLPMIFTRLLRSFNLPGGSTSFHIVRSNVTFESNAIVLWIIAMLGGAGSCQSHIGRLFKTLESYYHPSNNGKWMIKLQRLLCKLPSALIKRLYHERKKNDGWKTPIPKTHCLTDRDITLFVESMKDVVLLSVFSKGGSGDSATALKNLSLIRPEIVIPPLLDRLYSALETLTEPHRLTATMHCVVAVSRALVRSTKHFPEGPAHVIPLLMNCLPGIDPNDIKKCMVTFQFISTFTTLIPLVDCSKALNVRKDLTEHEQQLCLTTAQFEDFVLQFMDRCFSLIENSSLENPSRLDRDTAKRNIEESILEVGLSSTFVSILTQSSPEIFRSALSKLHGFVTTHILETKVSGKLAANMCRSASKVNAELSLKTFLPHFSKLVLALTDSLDVLEEEMLDDELLFGLLIMSELVRCDGQYLVQYQDILDKVISRTIHLKSREGYSLVGTLLRYILKALTFIHPLDFCSVKIDWDSCGSFEDYLPIRDWGKPGDLKNLNIEWHVPNCDELVFAGNLLDKFLQKELQCLMRWSSEQETMTREELQRSLSIVHNCILGAGEALPVWQQDNVDVVQASVPLYCTRIRNTGHTGISFSDGRNIRLSCAEVLRQVLVHILKIYEDDTKSLFLIVRIYNTLMFHWGVGKEDYEKRFKGFHVVKNALQDKLAGSKKHIRALLVDRVSLQHEIRMLERSKTALTPLHLSLMSDLLLLAVSHYSEIRSRAQAILLNCLHHFPFSYQAFTSDITGMLQRDPILHHDSFKGALYVVLGRKNHSILSTNDWAVLHQIWPALVATQPSEKPSIIRLLDSISESIEKYLETMQIRLEIPDSCVELAKKLWPRSDQNLISSIDQLIAEGLIHQQKKNADNFQHYMGLVDELQNLLENGGLHWRHYHLAFLMMCILTRHDVQFPAKTVKCFVKHLVHETLNIRKIAISTVAAILKQQKRPHAKRELDVTTIKVDAITLHPSLQELDIKERPDNLWTQYNSLTIPDTAEKWENAVFIHKTHTGFYCWSKPLLVYDRDSQQPVLDRARHELSEEEGAVFDCFSDPNFVETLMNYLSLEERKGHDKFDAKRFYLFKGLFRNFGDAFLPIFINLLKKKVVDNQESSQRCAAEILAGILRGSKHWSFAKSKALQEVAIPLLTAAFDNVTSETVADWGICVATVSESRDPNKFYWLFELLMDKPLRGDTGSFLESSRLYVLLGLLAQQEWRVFELLHRLLHYLEPHMKHAYQNVREKLGSMLCNIFLYDVNIPNASACLSLAPKRSTFIMRLLPKLSILVEDSTSNSVAGNFSNSVKDHALENNHFIDSEDSQEKKDARNLLKTICKWLQACVSRTLYSAPSEVYCFLPVLCLLQCDTVDDELSMNCMYTTAVMGQALLLPKSISTAIETVSGITKSVSWHARSTALSFLQLMVFSNLFTVMSNEKWVTDITRLVLELLGDERLEVREKSAETLGGFLHCEFIKVSDELIETFMRKCQRKLRKRKNGTADVLTVEPMDLIERHSGVLGLCACVNAYPYDVPPFLPEILVKLGDHLNDPQPIPATIKKTLSNFRRTHHDNWRDHKLRFTDDQLAVITDLLVSPSYYA